MEKKKLSLLAAAALALVVVPLALARGGEAAEPAGAPAVSKGGPQLKGAAPAVSTPKEPFSIEAAIEDLTQKFRAGGLTMWVILFLSVAALAFVLERTFRLRRGVIAPAGLAEQADDLWRDGSLQQLESLCQKRRSTLGRIIQFIVRHRDSPIADISAAAGDIASRDMSRHLMLTYPLAAVATLSPLLGLFGTVLGMIESFEMVAIAGSMGDPSLLASGISKALVTTAFGLFVAIPTLFFYHLFKLRTNYLAKLLEEEASTLMSEWLMKKEAGHEG
jgi:biopolymer transport protein ExbB